jgi:hypothetical protein
MHKYFDLKENHMNFLIFLFSKSNLDIFIDKYISSYFFFLLNQKKKYLQKKANRYLYIYYYNDTYV